MADIELVIKIPEEEYAPCKKQWDTECLDTLMIAVKYGTPLDEVLDKISAEVLEYIDDLDIAYEICGVFDKYKAESDEEK